MSGVAPTGRVLTWDAMTFRRFDEEGRVVERWIIGDDLGAAPPARAGLSPSTSPGRRAPFRVS